MSPSLCLIVVKVFKPCPHALLRALRMLGVCFDTLLEAGQEAAARLII
jgi:hypothetical protein